MPVLRTPKFLKSFVDKGAPNSDVAVGRVNTRVRQQAAVQPYIDATKPIGRVGAIQPDFNPAKVKTVQR